MLDLIAALLEGLIWSWAQDDDDRPRWLAIFVVLFMLLFVVAGAILLLMR